VKALVLDSVYDEPKEMVKVEVAKTGLAGFPFMVRSAELSFDWLNYEHRQDPPLSARMTTLNAVPKLFLQPADDQQLGDSTRKLFIKAPEPKEIAALPHGNYVALPEDEKHLYENRVVTFFLLKLPPTASPAK
jgi:hypothetical protein